MNRISISPELAIKVVLAVIAGCSIWFAADARLQKVEGRQDAQDDRVKEMRSDIKEIRRDVKDILVEQRRGK